MLFFTAARHSCMQPYDQFKEQGQVVFKALSPADVVVLQAVLQQQSSSTEDVLQLGQQVNGIHVNGLQTTGISAFSA